MTRAQTNVLLFGVGAFVFIALRRREPVATVTTSEGYDLTPYGGPASYPFPVIEFAKAIARQEGFYVRDSIPYRAHNPGDLKLPNTRTLPGSNGITQFADDNEGWQALYKQLYLILTGRSSRYDVGMTIQQMGDVWTTTQRSEWGQNVALFAGVSPDTPLYQVLT